MNKKQKEKLFKSIDLEDGFKDVLNDITNDLDKKYERIRTAEQVEIDKIKRKYNEQKEKYFSREKRISNELKTYLKDVEKYSTFKIIHSGNDIIDILTEIISLYKGQKYECGFIGNQNNRLLIYPEVMDIHYENHLDELIEEGNVLDFSDDLCNVDEEINFYELDKSSVLNSSILSNSIGTHYFKLSKNSQKYKFILEFIDLVVKYRMEKQTDDISFVELKRLEQAFIYSKKEEIDALNRKRSQEEREELEKKILERDALLDKYIDDNFDIIDELPSEVALGNVSSAKVLKKLIETYNETSEE